MEKIRKIFKALSMKGALNVYMTIYAGCQSGSYATFESLVRITAINENTLRRITNNLSRHRLIKSVRYGTTRGKFYIVSDKDFAKKLYDFIGM